MKKILLLLTFASLFSCSSDEDDIAPIALPAIPIESFLKASIDGTVYEFDKFVVETSTVIENGDTYTDLVITAEIMNDPAKTIEFRCEQFQPGSSSLYYFSLISDETEYDDTHIEHFFSMNITINEPHHLKGNFSGTLTDFEDVGLLHVNDGAFELAY